MDLRKTQDCQSDPEEKESWRHNTPRLQTVLQSYSNQNSVVLAQKQTYGSMEQNREPGNYGQLIFNKGGKNIKCEKDSLFSNGAGKTGQMHINQ